ncbi:MAG TPA: SIMPL domain-containing protein [Pusillimonas sp.]|uniref:SIMPL domain-containing protein n=1 Tax=Pusillimonas sp. TaxID=3040095 RepID=UPI002B994002|nr:SIMPL domain-containing protein [Pusillimonas sp.]HUH88625.1 SIMPL domain-containing protein [Pusillimonas sp.]
MYLSKQKLNWLAGLAAGLALALAMPAQAGDQGDPGDRGKREQRHWPQATLDAQASKEIQQDTVTITLAKELSDPSQANVVKALSEALDSVMKDAKGESKVQAHSGNYRVWPHSDDKGAVTNWRGRADIILKSTDFEAASQLAARLSDRMPIAGMGFSVAPETRARHEQELLAEAARAFQDRAQALAAAFGFESYSIKSVALGGMGMPYQPMPRMMAMAASADESARIPLEPGTEHVTVTMQGSIFLRSK